MARSAKQAERRAAEKRRPLHGGAAALGGLILRNPTLVGGSTAFLVALFYVSANALWYQPHAHLSAFFATRDFVRADSLAAEPESQTTFLIERPETQPSRLPSDPVTAQVQRILQDLNFYEGTVDGISGPATANAIQTYRRKVGLPASDTIDEALLEQLGARPTTAGITPSPAPRQIAEAAPRPVSAGQDRTAMNMKIQAGLKAFGNDDIGIDGVIGSRTRAAIREFQALFGLRETGEPDADLYAKMREIGLTN